MYLRQSTASQEIQLGKFVDDTDGKTAENGLTIANTDIKLFKHGATSQVSKNSGGATNMANGHYYAVLDATDTDTLGNLEITVDVAGALSVRREYVVLPAMVFDSMILGTDVLQADTTQWLGTACATPSVAGVPEVDLTHVAGSTTNVAALATNVDAILVDTSTTLQAELDGIQADTEDIQTRLPAALVSGRMDSSVGAMAANTLTASALATDATEEMADAILSRSVSTVEGTMGEYTLGTIILAVLEFSISGTTWTIKRTDGTTTHLTKTLTTEANADSVTGVA